MRKKYLKKIFKELHGIENIWILNQIYMFIENIQR